MGAYRSTGGRRSLMAVERARQMLDGISQRAKLSPKYAYRRERDDETACVAHDCDDIRAHVITI